MDIKLREGQFLVKLARKEIEAHFGWESPQIPEDMEELMSRKVGVFVKLNMHANHVLRGCAGYTEGILPLSDSLSEVALSAAIRDRRFRPLRKSELKSTVVEVSLLSEPKPITTNDPSEYPDQIRINRDGIIVEKDSMKGVLLPQIAVEFKWNSRQFLSHAAMSAGLKPNAWHDPDTKIYRFRAKVFAETKPCGKIIERKLP